MNGVSSLQFDSTDATDALLILLLLLIILLLIGVVLVLSLSKYVCGSGLRVETQIRVRVVQAPTCEQW